MKLKFERKSVKIINFFLKSVGIDVYQRNISSWKFYQFGTVLPTVSAIIHMFLYMFINRNNIKDIVVLAAFMGASVVLVASLRTFVQNKNNILELMQMIDKNVYSYPEETPNNLCKLNEENLSNILILILAYEFFGFSLSLLSPLFAFLITGVYQVSVYPGWYPLFENPILMTVTTILQLSGGIATFWLYYVIQIFITFVSIEFLRQYRHLRITLENIPSRTKDAVLQEMKQNSWYMFSDNPDIKIENNFEQKYNDMYQDNILHCIKHHQQLWKLFRLFEPWFSTFYSMELAMSAATFALVFNNLISATNPSTILTMIGSTFNVWANMFSRCIIGEIFTEMNISIRNTIFHDTNWWELSMENRNLLTIFHKTSSQLYEFKGCSIYTASYRTFIQLMRASYSYFNIIRSSLKEKD